MNGWLQLTADAAFNVPAGLRSARTSVSGDIPIRFRRLGGAAFSFTLVASLAPNCFTCAT